MTRIDESPQSAVLATSFKHEFVALIPQVRAFARFLCMNDRSASDDLSQEALFLAWQARASYQPGTVMRAWLFTIVRNARISEKRRSWRSVAWDDDLAAPRLRQADTQNETLDFDDLRRAMSGLPREQREALVLVTASGHSYAEAAGICGCAIGTIKSRINRGKVALANIMEIDRMPPRFRILDSEVAKIPNSPAIARS